ncbi:MAG: IS630 family transposase [Vampirovibrio sp.]|nr:IS630 family transposase [Vampirovibrio sp.]
MPIWTNWLSCSVLKNPPFPTTSLNSALAVKKSTLYRERSEAKRTVYKQEIEPLTPASLVFVDECGVDRRSVERLYGRSPKGERVQEEISGQRTERTSIIAGLQGGKPLAPWCFKGYCNTEVILTWVEHELLPSLTAGMTVIGDNASFHKSWEIQQLIESAGCRLLFLPPYSPDLNPIERFWSALKARIRRLLTDTLSLDEAIDQAFKMAQ